ncbi:ribonuclease HI [Arcobacter porcinus]|uniref:Ribonuclease H n=1 Tax=Arcobacter porcinus TaxID=1935204 RepID=A0ABX2YA27_9BACT|nr:RNase H family protein [Arcobacter porcinus]OCL83676.1 ribonuclease H [Arcobacter porcinus]OCL83895.1 ribonuclease H [Arcobacter porcinus]OCL89952.1 ribonuclease H [Arcobacter porcinus]
MSCNIFTNNKIELFVDSSVNPQSKIGFSAYLYKISSTHSLEELKNSIKTKKVENTSSTKLELQTFLWALEDIKNNIENIYSFSIVVYTDCQNIISLKNRKNKLEKNNFHSSSGKLINNHDLYKEFFDKTDEFNLSFVKVKGHKKTSLKDEIDDIFNLVDKASRSALRDYLSNF